MVDVELQASMLNLPLNQAVFTGVDEIVKFLRNAGYKGMQYLPVHTPRGYYRFDELAESGALTSFQQFLEHGSTLRPRICRAALPDIITSTKRVARLQSRLASNRYVNGCVPTVVHPNEQYLDGLMQARHINYRRLHKKGKLGPMLYRPSPEVLWSWGVPYGGTVPGDDTADILLSKQVEHSFAGVALDLGRLTTAQLSVKWTDEFLAALTQRDGLSGYNEVQVSFWPENEKDVEDMRKVMEGKLSDTRVGRLLPIIRDNFVHRYNVLRITVQVPPTMFRKIGHEYKTGNKVVCIAIKKLFGISVEDAYETDSAGHDLSVQ